ncbi:MAG: hypothetical protein OXM58_17650 [Rhodospirillaceae bacterium]|nr:hypothetical protein [Rhodospirillaceae bacterium]
MKLFSSNPVPPGIVIRQTFDMIVHTGEVKLRNHDNRSIDDLSQGVRENFVALAPEEANAVIGVQISTSIIWYDFTGAVIYLTFCGNPAIVEET